MNSKIAITLGFITLAAYSSASMTLYTESFDDVADAYGNTTLSALTSRGWAYSNLSSPAGLTSWFAGETSYITADQSSANILNPGSNVNYIAANYNNTTFSGGTISNYLFTPVSTLASGDTFTFETISDGIAPDSLEVLYSTNGSSTNVADFSHVALQINPTLSSSGYPTGWTQYTVTLHGIAAGTTGRLAFHYNVTNGGLYGANSSYIGIDSVKYEAVPEPTTIAVLLVGAAGFLKRRNRK